MEDKECNHDWKDIGSCYEGCCDKYECTKCGKIEYDEGAD